MSVIHERINQGLILQCFITRGEGYVSNMAKAVFDTMATNLSELPDVIPEILLDRFEEVHKFTYTLADFENMIVKVGLGYVYPIAKVVSDSDTPV